MQGVSGRLMGFTGNSDMDYTCRWNRLGRFSLTTGIFLSREILQCKMYTGSFIPKFFLAGIFFGRIFFARFFTFRIFLAASSCEGGLSIILSTSPLLLCPAQHPGPPPTLSGRLSAHHNNPPETKRIQNDHSEGGPCTIFPGRPESPVRFFYAEGGRNPRS